jgi:hypothetical protein
MNAITSMLTFKRYLKEIDEFHDYLKVDHSSERVFMRTCSKIFNDALGEKDNKARRVESNIPITIYFGTEKVSNIKSVSYVGKAQTTAKKKETEDDSIRAYPKADILVTRHDGTTVPISLKAENSRWGKATTLIKSLADRYKAKEPEFDKKVFITPKEVAINAIFGSDIQNGGFILKEVGSMGFNSFEKMGKNTYKISGLVIKTLNDVPEKIAPRIQISNTIGQQYDILQKNKVDNSIPHEILSK